jgi:hypothetical protein
LGLPLDSFVQARVLDLCAQKYGEPHARGERLAVDLLAGRKPVWQLDLVFAAAPAKKGDKSAALAAATTTTEAAPETDEDRKLHKTYLDAIPLAAAHTPTQQRVAETVDKCLYAREIGLIDQPLIERYVRTFVEIACLQVEMRDANGKLDEMAHAQAAARSFQQNAWNAADFAKVGVVFGRFPVIQQQLQTKKAARCPDPRVAAQEAVARQEWTGDLKGDRNAVLNLHATGGGLEGAAQWLGVPMRADDGRAQTQPALPLKGALSGKSISLMGQVGDDWLRLTGGLKNGALEGSWQGEVDHHKLKGTWRAQEVTPPPTAATPTAP